jgi:hypothetical protein
MNKPIDPALLAVARKKKSNDDPLYSANYGIDPMLSDVWEYHHWTKSPKSWTGRSKFGELFSDIYHRAA